MASADGIVQDLVAPVTRDTTMIPVAVAAAASRRSGETANSGSPLPVFRAAAGMPEGPVICCGFPSSPSRTCQY